MKPFIHFFKGNIKSLSLVVVLMVIMFGLGYYTGSCNLRISIPPQSQPPLVKELPPPPKPPRFNPSEYSDTLELRN